MAQKDPASGLRLRCCLRVQISASSGPFNHEFREGHAFSGSIAKALTPFRGINAHQLVRTVIGWPEPPENPKDWEKADQSALDADLDSRLRGYFHDLGANANAAFNTMTDLAARLPQSPRFGRDRPTLERRSAAWLRDFSTASTRAVFTIAGHLAELAGQE